jgi:hypothetical protein
MAILQNFLVGPGWEAGLVGPVAVVEFRLFSPTKPAPYSLLLAFAYPPLLRVLLFLPK